MKDKEERIDVEAAWAQFEQKAAAVEPAEIWTRGGAIAPQLQGAMEERQAMVTMVRSHEASGDRPRSASRSLRFRPWMALAAAVVLLIGLFTTSAGDKVLAAMLQTFRVQHISGVELGQSDFEKLRAGLEQSGVTAGELNLEKYGSLSHTGGGNPQVMPLQEVNAVFGAQVKPLPGLKADQTTVRLEPETQVTLKLHIDEVNRMLKRLGGKTMFPQSADGQPIVATVPASVQMADRSYSAGGARRTLIQMMQPTLDVPAGVDVEQVRMAVLELPFLPDSVRSKLEGASDWKQTLFLPAAGSSMRTVTVGGREVIVEEGTNWRSAAWLDGSFLYRLTGTGGAYVSEEALLNDVKEIIGS